MTYCSVPPESPEPSDFMLASEQPALYAEAIATFGRLLGRESRIGVEITAQLLRGGPLSGSAFERRRREFGDHAAAIILSGVREWLTLDAREYGLTVTEGVSLRQDGSPELALQLVGPGQEHSGVAVQVTVDFAAGNLPYTLISVDASSKASRPRLEFVRATKRLAQGEPAALVAASWCESGYVQRSVMAFASTPAVGFEAVRRGLTGAERDRFMEAEITRRAGTSVRTEDGFTRLLG